MEHQEYPKLMTHPAYDPGSIGEEVRSPSGFVYYRNGRPVRLPPVTVHNTDDEEYHKAIGYVPSGKSDPAAFARAFAVTPATANYEPQEYPKWVGDVLVQNEEEENALLETQVKTAIASDPVLQCVEDPGRDARRAAVLERMAKARAARRSSSVERTPEEDWVKIKAREAKKLAAEMRVTEQDSVLPHPDPEATETTG